MGKVFLHWFIVFIFFSVSITGFSKTIGNFKCYHQLTDKQIVIESTNGVKILINAVDNEMLGISIYEPEEKVDLISPTKIIGNNSLTGSIYVEELDEKMQITTTASDGFVIRIEKYPLSLSYYNKQFDYDICINNKFLLKEKSCELLITSPNDEKIDILTKQELTDNMFHLNKGESYNTSGSLRENILISSKGYALHFDSHPMLTFNYSQTGKVSISIQKIKNEPYCFYFIYGSNIPVLDSKLVFNDSKKEIQVF